MASKKKKAPQFHKTIYALPLADDRVGDVLPCTDNIQEHGYGDNEVWGEYQLVRKVKVRSEFIMEEI